MKEQLAINGGPRGISQAVLDKVPAWPIIHPETAELLKQIYLSGEWSFNGPYEQRFSKLFARYQNTRHGIFMVNGTVTIQCALKAVGVKEGDEVIVPALTWLATAMAAIYIGAKPVFVDIEPDTLCLDPEKMKKAITSKTKAVIPVHLYGSMADMEAIMAIAEQHGLVVIEDCAHAHGGIWNGRGVGSIGRIGSFSFQQSKTLPCGEGGICLTSDAELAEKLFRLKHIGYDLTSDQGEVGSGPSEGLICHNFRGAEFQAAILLDNLKYLQAETELRHKNANILRDLLADVDGVKIQSPGRLADLQSYYCLIFMVDTGKVGGIALAELARILNAEGLGVEKSSYGPVYRHKLWSVSGNDYRVENCDICEDMCENHVLPLGHRWLLSDEQAMRAIADVMKKVFSA